MKRFSYAVALSLPLLAACGGGGSTSEQLPQQQPVTAPLGSLSESQSDAQSEAIRKSSSGAADLLYVGNTGSNSITVYNHAAQGNTAPLYVISGPNTGINAPGQLSEDAQGNLYVANGDWQLPSTNPAILVFAHGANGNVAPIRKLAGPLTGINNVNAMTVDQGTGKMFVVDSAPGTNGRIVDVRLLRFPPKSSGNVAPFARSTPDLDPAYQLASDSTGQNVIEAHFSSTPSVAGFGTATIAKQFANNTHPSFPYSIGFMYALGVADDPTTKTYLVASGAYGIYRLAENTVGYGPLEGPENLKPTPVSIITSDTCGTQLAVAPGPTPYTYVTHSRTLFANGGGGCPADAVYVYANRAAGNASPLRILSGSATGLSAPYGIYEGK